MPRGRHMTKPYAFYMVSIQQACGKARCLLCGMHMASTWLNHIGAIWIPYVPVHGNHIMQPYTCHVVMIQPYSYHINATQQAYDYTICLLYGYHTEAIWHCHMPSLWHLQSRHMAKSDACYVAGIWHLYDYTISLPCRYHRGGIWIWTWKSHCIVYTPPYGINMTAVWFSHIQLPYINAMQQAYDQTICLLYACHHIQHL